MSIERIVEIASDNRHLAAYRGFMTVSEGKQELGRIPLDDISAVIANAHGLTYSNNLLTALAQRGAPFVICGPNHSPAAFMWAVDGHHMQSARIDAQLNATQPKAKQLWKQIIQGKILGQAAVLEALDKPHAPVKAMADKVRSGDPDNIEGQAARRYWGILFGSTFRRNRALEGANALLNYGYTIIRASVARAVLAAGLHPGIGIHHRNAYNAMRLVDDMIEPYRPYTDFVVWHLLQEGCEEVTPDAKKLLASMAEMAIPMSDGIYPMRRAIQKTVQSLARVYEERDKKLELPVSNPPLWQAQESGYGTFERAQTDVDDGYV